VAEGHEKPLNGLFERRTPEAIAEGWERHAAEKPLSWIFYDLAAQRSAFG
jgi:hypothetical protein